MPFNAIVHAVSACIVFLILRKFFPAVPSWLGALLFALNPSSLEWVAQIHRDGLFILGSLLVINQVLELWKRDNAAKGVGRIAWILLVMSSGTVLFWMARPYWIHVNIVLTGPFILSVLVLWIICSGLSWRVFINWVIVVCGYSYLCFFLIGTSESYQFKIFEQIKKNQEYSEYVSDYEAASTERGANVGRETWRKSDALPKILESRLYGIYIARLGAMSLGGATLIDKHRSLNSAGAIILYIPRAAQIGLFSPFPNIWLGEGSSDSMTMARRVVGLSTILLYICAIGAFVGFATARTNLSVWLLFGVCIGAIIVGAVPDNYLR